MCVAGFGREDGGVRDGGVGDRVGEKPSNSSELPEAAVSLVPDIDSLLWIGWASATALGSSWAIVLMTFGYFSSSCSRVS